MMRKEFTSMKYKHSAQFYNKRYGKYKAEMLKEGLTPISKGAFVATYETIANDTKNPSKNPMKDIIYSAKYQTTYNAAVAEKKALQKIGIKVKLEDLKKITTHDFANQYASELSRAYRDLRSAGKTGKEAALLISQQWFGSK